MQCPQQADFQVPRLGELAHDEAAQDHRYSGARDVRQRQQREGAGELLARKEIRNHRSYGRRHAGITGANTDAKEGELPKSAREAAQGRTNAPEPDARAENDSARAGIYPTRQRQTEDEVERDIGKSEYEADLGVAERQIVLDGLHHERDDAAIDERSEEH